MGAMPLLLASQRVLVITTTCSKKVGIEIGTRTVVLLVLEEYPLITKTTVASLRITGANGGGIVIAEIVIMVRGSCVR